MTKRTMYLVSLMRLGHLTDQGTQQRAVSRVMKTQLHTMPAYGICIRDVGE